MSSLPGYDGRPAPEDYRVLAIMPVYNEADILRATIHYLARRDIDVLVLDDWSTDGSYELASDLVGRGVTRVERVRPIDDCEEDSYSLADVARRVAQLSQSECADWVIWHDADEYFQSPWAGVGLRDALYQVDREGFNALDHIVVTFPPTDDSFRPGGDFLTHFRHWRLGYGVPGCVWVRSWKPQRGSEVCFPQGSHEVWFRERRICPMPFLIRHYPIRSQAHGTRKVFRERRPRYSCDGLARGWHVQYDGYREGDSFLERPDVLYELDETRFQEQVLTAMGVQQ